MLTTSSTTAFQVCAFVHKFTGKERDTESGLDNFGARYYASNMGRMMSPDPANPQSWNMYGYSLNNPLRFTDPTGLYVCEDSTKCDSKNDQAFAKSLADAQAAANKLTGANQIEAQKAIDAYGAQGVDNGVNVRFDSNVQGAATEVSGIANGEKSADNPNGQNINVTFNPNSVGGQYDSGIVAHEGSHVSDASAWVASGFSASMDPTRYQTEINAYRVQFNIFSASPGVGLLIDPKIGTAPVDLALPFSNSKPAIQQMLQNDPKYKFTFKDKTAAFAKGGVLPR